MESLRTAQSLAQSNQRVEREHQKVALAHALSRPEKDDGLTMATKMQQQHQQDGRISSSSERERAADTDEDDEQEERGQRESTQGEDDELELEHEPFDASELRARCQQLQDDVEVLAAHLETQTLEREKERAAMRLLQNQLQHANMEMARELHSFRIENDALRHQNALLQTQRDELEQKAALAGETQDELLLALKQHQQSEEQLKHANVLIVRERAQVRKALEATQNHCRRLEEELAAMQTHLMQLQRERTALEVAAAATSTTQLSHEGEQIKLQDEMISSLRADLLQMEFEYKTLALDRETLHDQVGKLQKQLSASRSGAGAYDVIPLGKTSASNKPLSSKQQQKLLKEQEKQKQKQQQKEQEKQKLQQQQAKKNIRPARSLYESENGGFSGVMELPNYVSDRRESSGRSSSSGSGELEAAAAGELRRRSSFSSLVSKTMSSTRKRFFALSPPNKLVLPQ